MDTHSHVRIFHIDSHSQVHIHIDSYACNVLTRLYMHVVPFLDIRVILLSDPKSSRLLDKP